ncbi:tol-pal system protein YbgF [Nitrosospira sp. Nsp1]|uniref:tol-pal system protein YbgF n=1 Tax=Nitrosospira sp. Nsp1 TaxID=136547 RepID=UPI00088E9C03|nr:tol-pal system protein YbgF [Nitrosospira sp. Nsp1]SCX55636.1 tol-pal system protein YbgF [Nitrosospira sp. Nsp1]
MPLRAFWLVFVIGCNASYAGVFDDEEARRQIAVQKTAIGEVRNQGQALESRVVKLEDLLNNQPLLELHSQIEALRLDLNKLQGQIEVLVNENESSQKRQRDFYIDLDSRLRRIEQPDETAASGSAVSGSAEAAAEPGAPDMEPEPAAAVPATAAAVVSSAASTPAKGVSSASAKDVESDAYEAAYSLFKAGSYQDAISRFNKFLRSYPGSSFAPSAHYWIGNSYYALRDFKSAISAQEKLIKTYPDSAKAPDAMLNIASSQQEMNKKPAARKTLETLVAKYPGSEAADKAKRRLISKK